MGPSGSVHWSSVRASTWLGVEIAVTFEEERFLAADVWTLRVSVSGLDRLYSSSPDPLL